MNNSIPGLGIVGFVGPRPASADFGTTRGYIASKKVAYVGNSLPEELAGYLKKEFIVTHIISQDELDRLAPQDLVIISTDSPEREIRDITDKQEFLTDKLYQELSDMNRKSNKREFNTPYTFPGDTKKQHIIYKTEDKDAFAYMLTELDPEHITTRNHCFGQEYTGFKALQILRKKQPDINVIIYDSEDTQSAGYSKHAAFIPNGYENLLVAIFEYTGRKERAEICWIEDMLEKKPEQPKENPSLDTIIEKKIQKRYDNILAPEEIEQLAGAHFDSQPRRETSPHLLAISRQQFVQMQIELYNKYKDVPSRIESFSWLPEGMKKKL